VTHSSKPGEKKSPTAAVVVPRRGPGKGLTIEFPLIVEARRWSDWYVGAPPSGGIFGRLVPSVEARAFRSACRSVSDYCEVCALRPGGQPIETGDERQVFELLQKENEFRELFTLSTDAAGVVRVAYAPGIPEETKKRIKAYLLDGARIIT
jgi:hypothetical protein